jgi:hypothetical protein
MEIEAGKIFVNKTWKYLLPVTRHYGPTFRAKFGNVWKLVVGIGDAFYDTKGKRCLFILIDRKWYPEKVKNTLDWVKNQSYYVDDYPFDDIAKGRQHMIVIEFPEKYINSYHNFLKGEYSKMFNDRDVDRFFKDQIIKDAYYVLTRTTKAYDKFIKNVKLSFESEVTHNDLRESELDFPPEPEKEIFNYGAE